jgi:hypothetical protein
MSNYVEVISWKVRYDTKTVTGQGCPDALTPCPDLQVMAGHLFFSFYYALYDLRVTRSGQWQVRAKYFCPDLFCVCIQVRIFFNENFGFMYTYIDVTVDMRI